MHQSATGAQHLSERAVAFKEGAGPKPDAGELTLRLRKQLLLLFGCLYDFCRVPLVTYWLRLTLRGFVCPLLVLIERSEL